MESGQNIALFTENEPFRATKMWNELVRNFKTGVRLKKKRWRMKYYEDCFSGSDALAWIHDFLKLNPNFGQNVSRTQAKLLCQKLLQRNVFEDVVGQFKSTKPVFEENHLYSFVNKSSVGCSNAKENANSISKVDMSSKKVASSLKRHSSFSGRLQFTRKPLGDRKALQNITREGNDKDNPKLIRMKPTRTSMKQSSNNEKGGLVLQNLGTVNAKSGQPNVRLRGKHTGKGVSGLTRKWKSEYDITLMERNEECDERDDGCLDKHDEEIVHQDKKPTDHKGMSNENTQTTWDNSRTNLPGKSNENIQTTADNDLTEHQGLSNKDTETTADNGLAGQPGLSINKDTVQATVNNCRGEHLPQTDPNEFWMTVCLERLQHALNVNNLNDILDVDLLSWKNVMENSTSDLRCVTEAVPKWLVSAMKCLIHWPQSVDSHAADYSGFENYVFKTIQEHFQLLPEPFVPSNFIEVFTKISGLITKCKLSGIRALQHALLLLKKEQRQQLQLLLRFMIKISNNHQLNLSCHLPTRELVIQTLVPCIFGGKESRNVHEILGIRITSFIMENYAEVFKVPDGLKFEVEQQIAFRKGIGNVENQSNDIAFCFRVTKQDYDEQKQFGTQRFLEDLLDSIVQDEKINEKERKKKLKQFQKTYPEIYFGRYPADGLSMMSQQPAKLRRVMKPLTRRHVKNLR